MNNNNNKKNQSNMYTTVESLAAALRVFVSRNKKFSCKSFRNAMAKCLSKKSFDALFEELGQRSDCYTRINKHYCMFICKRDFFNDTFVYYLVDKLGLKRSNRKKPHTRLCSDDVLSLMDNEFTGNDIVKKTGLSKHGAHSVIDRLLRRGKIYKIKYGRYSKTKPEDNPEPKPVNKPIENKPKQVDRPLKDMDLQTIMDELSYRGLQWRLYGGPRKQPMP